MINFGLTEMGTVFMVGQPVSIFNARVKTVCLCFGIDREKAGRFPFRKLSEFDRMIELFATTNKEKRE